MAQTTVIITRGGQTIEINHKGENGQLDAWMFSLNVERFLYKNYPDRYNLQITARNAFTQEVICVHRYRRSPNLLDLKHRLNEANEIFQSLLTAIENKDNVWDARERT
jgi:hypothetical protein